MMAGSRSNTGGSTRPFKTRFIAFVPCGLSM
jgi:hypothetical protein